MNVLLINPPREIPQRADFPPIGLAYIASFLRRHDVHVNVLDAASFSWRKLKKAVAATQPEVIGVPCWTMERGQSFRAAKIARKIHPRAKLIMGGHHATAFPGHMFELAGADAVVMGEGEITTLELIRAFDEDDDLQTVKGIVFRKNGNTVFTEPRALISDLDSLPYPCHDDFDLDRYLGLPERKGRAASIMTSRGCPHRCIYCSGSKFWRRKWRARSPENVLGEIEWLYRDMGVKNFIFFDDNFTVNKDRAIEICRSIIDRKLRIQYVAESHVAHIDEELLKWMKNSGCYRIDFGVESGSPKILKNIKKKQTVEQIETVFKLVHGAGIKPRGYLMVGNPGEDDETIQETADLMKRADPWDTQGAFPLLIMPNTEIYQMAMERGIISDDFWLHNDSMLYYTAEHSEKELMALRELLMKKMAQNNKRPAVYARYLLKKWYYRYPVLQKLRRWRGVFSTFIAP